MGKHHITSLAVLETEAPHFKPTLFDLAVTRILTRERAPPFTQKPPNVRCYLGGPLRVYSSCPIAHVEVIGPQTVLPVAQPVVISEPCPGCVDTDDSAGLVQNRYMLRHCPHRSLE